MFESSGLFALPAKYDRVCTAIVAMAKICWGGSNPLIGIQLLPCLHVACNRRGTFATLPFAEHVIPTIESPVNVLIRTKPGIQSHEDVTTLLTIHNLQYLRKSFHGWTQATVRRLVTRIPQAEPGFMILGSTDPGSWASAPPCLPLT